MYIIGSIVIMALVTYLIRVIPLTCFRKKIQSRFVHSFLYYVPYVVLATMTFPDIIDSVGNWKYAIVGTAVALIFAFREKGLTTVAIASVVAVYACYLIF